MEQQVNSCTNTKDMYQNDQNEIQGGQQDKDMLGNIQNKIDEIEQALLDKMASDELDSHPPFQNPGIMEKVTGAQYDGEYQEQLLGGGSQFDTNPALEQYGMVFDSQQPPLPMEGAISVNDYPEIRDEMHDYIQDTKNELRQMRKGTKKRRRSISKKKKKSKRKGSFSRSQRGLMPQNIPRAKTRESFGQLNAGIRPQSGLQSQNQKKDILNALKKSRNYLLDQGLSSEAQKMIRTNYMKLNQEVQIL